MRNVSTNGERVYTLDGKEAYRIYSKHLGISRILQSFEVVLWTVFTRSCLEYGLLLLSLDNDGLLCLCMGNNDVFETSEYLTHSVQEWSQFLLEGKSLSIVSKMMAYAGEVHKL